MTGQKKSLLIVWIAIVLLPNFTTIAFLNRWEFDYRALLLISVFSTLFLYQALSRKWFFIATYPIAICGTIVVGADCLRSANVLELVSIAKTFKASEVIDVCTPYLWAVGTTAILLAIVGLVLSHGDALPGTSKKNKIATVLVFILLICSIPYQNWSSAWPMNLMVALAEANAVDLGIPLPDTPNVRSSPRNRFSTWKASREEQPSEPETYVLVIGESLRSDRINGCGGRSLVTAPSSEAIVYCDVLSGSSSTHTSVPLLVSREMPGHLERVSSDTTFLNAFETVGFETFWLSVQDKTIAWPDARNQFFGAFGKLDRDTLLPLLNQALERPQRRKVIVIHAYNAHGPYDERYKPETAPFSVDQRLLRGQVPSESNMGNWWNAYDNAVDESIRFTNDLIYRLSRQNGQVFLAFTPDHGENMRDDYRFLIHHALKLPTKWDTKVPGIFWANSVWRKAHPKKWDSLISNRKLPVMHMDFVPTILGAAGIAYDDKRNLPIDLSSQTVTPRTRFTQVRLGQIVDASKLDIESINVK